MVSVLDIPNQLTVSYGAPNAVTTIGATGDYEGQHYYQIGGATQGYRRNIWVWDATTGAWLCMPISPILGTGNPNGSVIPDTETQQFLSTDTGNFYVATGVTSSDWTLTN